MKSSKILKWILLTLSGISLFIALQYTVLSVIAVKKVFRSVCLIKNEKLNEINLNDSTRLNLYRQKNWLESRLKMAQSDSIYLTINLQDSTLQLELKGVVLKSSSIQKLKYDPFFKALPPSAYHYYFGQEALGEHTVATISKVPLTIKKAPKDTIEFEIQSQITDSIKVESVNWQLHLNNGIEIKISGASSNKTIEKSTKAFWRKQKTELALRKLKKTITFSVPPYNPTIEIEVDQADAKAIYRAIPDQPMVSIRL